MSGARSTELTEGNARTTLVYLHTEALTSGTPANGVPYSVTVKAPCLWTQVNCWSWSPPVGNGWKAIEILLHFLWLIAIFFWLIAKIRMMNRMLINCWTHVSRAFNDWESEATLLCTVSVYWSVLWINIFIFKVQRVDKNHSM